MMTWQQIGNETLRRGKLFMAGCAGGCLVGSAVGVRWAVERFLGGSGSQSSPGEFFRSWSPVVKDIVIRTVVDPYYVEFAKEIVQISSGIERRVGAVALSSMAAASVTSEGASKALKRRGWEKLLLSAELGLAAGVVAGALHARANGCSALVKLILSIAGGVFGGVVGGAATIGVCSCEAAAAKVLSDELLSGARFGFLAGGIAIAAGTLSGGLEPRQLAQAACIAGGACAAIRC